MIKFRDGGGHADIDIIPPEHRSIAVRRHAFAGASGIADAEFESLRGSFGKPGLVERKRDSAGPAPRPTGGRRSLPLPSLAPFVEKYGFPVLVVALSLATFWISGGHALAERSPPAITSAIVVGDNAD
jgi:hypothetical protein